MLFELKTSFKTVMTLSASASRALSAGNQVDGLSAVVRCFTCHGRATQFPTILPIDLLCDFFAQKPG